MKCPKCGSEHLELVCFNNFDYILSNSKNGWITKDPGIQSFYESTSKDRLLMCLDCHHDEKFEGSIEKFLSPKIEHTEIVFDLDHTLFHCEFPEYMEKYDFTFSDADKKWTYAAVKRPHLDEFLQNCLKRFEKISFFTAATEWYAHELIKSLNIPKEKIGFIKTRVDTIEGRPLSFDRGLLKPMENCLVIDDKPLVIKGKNNRVLKIKPFFYGDLEDAELLRIWNRIEAPDFSIHRPKTASGLLWIFLRDIEIPIKDLPWEKVRELLLISPTTEEEMKGFYRRTSFSPNSYDFENEKIEVYISDCSYQNYLKALSILESFTDHKAMSKEQYEKIVKKPTNPADNF